MEEIGRNSLCIIILLELQLKLTTAQPILYNAGNLLAIINRP
jgi:hypothetical protein